MRLYLGSLLLLLLVLSGCGSDHTATSTQTEQNSSAGSPEALNNLFAVPAPEVCTLSTRKKFVYDVMHDSYLWADETKVIDYDDNTTYPDEEILLKDLRNPLDRFSFIMPKKAYDNFFVAGKNIGYGIYFQLDVTDDGNVTAMDILLVYPGSPAGLAGLRRSDKITAIDGKSVDTVLKDAALEAHYFEEDKPVSAIFHVVHADSSQSDLNITKSEYDVKSVIKSDIFETPEKRKVGYLLFQSFVGTSEKELNTAFNTFKKAGVDDLVLDLRYNGGGYIYIANQLGSLIGGWRSLGKIFNKTVFNSRYSRYNSETRFHYLTDSISLPRVFILTTKTTCSASELVINALRAQSVDVEVVQIGGSTCGKPYGMYPLYYCERYLLAVDTKNTNADGVGDYVDGIAPQCKADDDITHDFMDPQEKMFATALYYIQNDSCPPAERARALRPKMRPLPEKGYRSRYAIY